MNKNLFVRNISYKATNQDLQSLFETVGTVVSAKIIFDKEQNRSKGYGFVEFASEDEAERIIIDSIFKKYKERILNRPSYIFKYSVFLLEKI